MKNKTKSTLTLVVALMAFLFFAPKGVFASNLHQVVTITNLSPNYNGNSASNISYAKCGASHSKTVKTDKKKGQKKCNSGKSKSKKEVKKTGQKKSGSKADSAKKKAKKGQGKCGQGKCGGGL